MSDEDKKLKEKAFENAIDEIEKALDEKISLWNGTIHSLSNKLNNCDPKKLIDIQAEIISQKQNITDEVRIYVVKVAKDLSKKKALFKPHYEFYKNKYPIKQSTGETAKLIESDLYLHERKLDVYAAYIEFLKESLKNLESLNFGVKNRIELINQYGVE